MGYIKKRKSSTTNKNDQQEEDALIGGDGMSDRTLETASETVSDKTDEETQRMMDEMDEMTLDEMNRMAELEEEQGKRGLQMTEIKVSADQSKLSEVDEEREHDVKEGKKLKADIAQAEEEIKKGDPLTRRRAKKRKALLLKKCRVRKNLFNLVTKWFLTYHGRQGNLPVIKRLVEKMGRRAEDEGSADAAVPHHLGGHHKPLLDAVFVNVARSAARFKHKKVRSCELTVHCTHYLRSMFLHSNSSLLRSPQLLTWLIKDWGVDINAQNVMGFPLITFAISSYGNDDGGEMLRYMHEDLGADVTILNDFGQNALFFAVANYKNCISYIDYFVDVCELDPKNVDKFNCSLLHWATLHGNLEAIKYIYERDWQVHSRAHWGKVRTATTTHGMYIVLTRRFAPRLVSSRPSLAAGRHVLGRGLPSARGRTGPKRLAFSRAPQVRQLSVTVGRGHPAQQREDCQILDGPGIDQHAMPKTTADFRRLLRRP